MSRPIASVHIDIGEFVLEVSEVQGGDAALGRWVRQLARSLGRRDPALHEYGGRLLAEAARFASGASERGRAAALSRWGNQGESGGQDAPASAGMRPDAPASGSMPTRAPEQSSTDQTGQGDPPLTPPGDEPMSAHAVFEAARKAWPGVRRGFEPEWELFRRKVRGAEAQVLPLLLPAVRRYKAHAEKKARQDGRPPLYQHFKTWINQQGWTMEFPGEAPAAAAQGASAVTPAIAQLQAEEARAAADWAAKPQAEKDAILAAAQAEAARVAAGKGSR